jgi:hypothetical protein
MIENHVAEYTEVTHTCQACKGSGSEKITKEQLLEIMDSTTLEHAIHIYKQWRYLDGEIDCGDCNGEGSWTERH